MKRSVLFWIIAFVITIASGIYQRLTGPTYSLSGTTTFEDMSISYRFDRSSAGASDAPVVLPVEDADARATLLWRPHESGDLFAEVPMEYSNGAFRAVLPGQEPLMKLDYQVRIEKDQEILLVPTEPVTIRFKGEVPMWVIIPHVLAMFAAMLFSLRAGLESFMPEPAYTRLVLWTLGFLVLGGFVFGPLMTRYAFNLWWTGWPVGSDMTDNKTLLALLGWIVAAAGLKWSKSGREWILAAAALMLAIFLIPHSIS